MIDPHHSHRAAGQMALSAVHSLLRGKGWEVEKDVGEGEDLFLTSPHGQTYFVQLKAISEGRADRVIPLFAQALLESRVHANEWGESPSGCHPLGGLRIEGAHRQASGFPLRVR